MVTYLQGQIGEHTAWPGIGYINELFAFAVNAAQSPSLTDRNQIVTEDLAGTSESNIPRLQLT